MPTITARVTGPGSLVLDLVQIIDIPSAMECVARVVRGDIVQDLGDVGDELTIYTPDAEASLGAYSRTLAALGVEVRDVTER